MTNQSRQHERDHHVYAGIYAGANPSEPPWQRIDVRLNDAGKPLPSSNDIAKPRYSLSSNHRRSNSADFVMPIRGVMSGLTGGAVPSSNNSAVTPSSDLSIPRTRVSRPGPVV